MEEKKEKGLFDVVLSDNWKRYNKCAKTIAEAVKKSSLDNKLKDKGASISECAGNMFFLVNQNTGEKRLKHVFFCRQRLCPICQKKLSQKRKQDLIKIVEQLQVSDFLFITFTINNCRGEDLRKTIERINKGFVKMYRNRLNNERTNGFCSGYYKRIAVTYNEEDDTYNPYIHVAVSIDKSYYHRNRMTLKEWKSQWQKYLGLDYLTQVSVKSVRNNKEGLMNEICQITKPDLLIDTGELTSVAKRFELMDRQLSNLKMITTGGVFQEAMKKLNIKSEMESADLLTENI